MRADQIYSTTLFGNLTRDKLNELKDSTDPWFVYVADVVNSVRISKMRCPHFRSAHVKAQMTGRFPFQAVHTPLEAPKFYIDKYADTIADKNRRVKAAMMTMTDDVINELVTTLQANGQWDDTLVVWLSFPHCNDKTMKLLDHSPHQHQ